MRTFIGSYSTTIIVLLLVNLWKDWFGSAFLIQQGTYFKSHRRSFYRTNEQLQLQPATHSDDSINNIKHDTLTLEELSLRFQGVLEHYNKTKEMSQQDVRRAMLRTRLPNLTLRKCHVGPSSIPNAGQGLFASQDIAENELITLYPGDALLLWSKQVGDFSGDVGVLFGNHVSNRNATRATCDDARNYEIKLSDTASLVADSTLIDDAAYLGHMMNDGAACLEDSLAARSDYSQRTMRKYNAAIVPIQECHYAAVATKNISTNEEIFVSYGEGYWLSRLRKQQATAATSTAKGGAGKKPIKKKQTKRKVNGGSRGIG